MDLFLYFAGILFDSTDRPLSQGSAAVAVGMNDIEASGTPLNIKSNVSPSEHSVIIPAGATLSIPLGYAAGSPSTSGTIAKTLSTRTVPRLSNTGTGAIAGPANVIKSTKQETNVTSSYGQIGGTQREEKYSDLG